MIHLLIPYLEFYAIMHTGSRILYISAPMSTNISPSDIILQQHNECNRSPPSTVSGQIGASSAKDAWWDK